MNNTEKLAAQKYISEEKDRIFDENGRIAGEAFLAGVEWQRTQNGRLLNGMVAIVRKDPQAVSREEAADMAVEFHGIASWALQSQGESRSIILRSEKE